VVANASTKVTKTSGKRVVKKKSKWS
jgi:hypothetical protein